MSGDEFTHALCGFCWTKLHPDHPVADGQLGMLEICCRCGAHTRSGINVRAEPTAFDHCAHRGEPE